MVRIMVLLHIGQGPHWNL